MVEAKRHGYPSEVFSAMENKFTPKKVETGYRGITDLKETMFSNVFTAVNRETGNQVAIKYVRLDSIVKDNVPRAIQELDIVRNQLVDVECPFLLIPEEVVYDTERGIGIVTPWAEYGELGPQMEHFSSDGEVVASLGMQIALGLEELHTHGIVHRDLKPENIFVNKQGSKRKFQRYQVGDFGLAAIQDYLNKQKTRYDSVNVDELDPELEIWDERLTPIRVAMGTPSYMSPEQAKSSNFLTPKSDLFTLGTILYEAISGTNPFHDGSAMAIMLNIVHGIRYGDTQFRLKELKGLTADKTKQLKDIVMSLLITSEDRRGERQYGDKLNTAGDVAAAIAELWADNQSALVTNTQEYKMATQLTQE